MFAFEVFLTGDFFINRPEYGALREVAFGKRTKESSVFYSIVI